MKHHRPQNLARHLGVAVHPGWRTASHRARLRQSVTQRLECGRQNLLVKGYDVVANFTMAAPTDGKARFVATHQGATYWFPNEVNRKAFKNKPERYAPQFGALCAMGVALDQKFDGDPQTWRIENDRLYLNLNTDIQSTWMTDVPGHLLKANDDWPKIKNKAPKNL